MTKDELQVLIIDDDNRNIFALRAMLKSKGYRCTTAQSAVEGIHLLASGPAIGIVLMDMMMPDMDGYEAIAQIRHHQGFDSIPIIAVTAQAMVGDREKCLAAGADDYVSKPIDIDMLVSLLKKYMNV